MTENYPRGYDTYNLVVHLLNLQDQNLPPFKDARVKRIASTKKIVNLIKNCLRTAPVIPPALHSLDANDPEWDDGMIYPKINHSHLFARTAFAFGLLGFYAYNYPVFTYNIRFKFIRYTFPFLIFGGFYSIYRDYTRQYEKCRLFDEYCNIRAQELIEQNSYLLEHPDVKKYYWWSADLKDTLARVHRQANNHDASDFADSEIILQDFLRRYSDPSKKFPTEREDGSLVIN